MSVWASVAVGSEPGVWIDEADPLPPPVGAVVVTIAVLAHGSIRTTRQLQELAGVAQLHGSGPVGCELLLGRTAGPITFGFEGPIKPTIDCFWPVLGGEPHRPHDHRIRDLGVGRRPGLVSTNSDGNCLLSPKKSLLANEAERLRTILAGQRGGRTPSNGLEWIRTRDKRGMISPS